MFFFLGEALKHLPLICSMAFWDIAVGIINNQISQEQISLIPKKGDHWKQHATKEVECETS